MINDLVQKITKLKQSSKTLLVAIDGRGGSGKSTLATSLKGKLENVTTIHLDDFAYPMGGADDFVAKPFDMQDLLAKVAQHIK